MLGYRPLLVLLGVAQGTLICRGKVAFGKHLGVSQRHLGLVGLAFRGIVEQVIAVAIERLREPLSRLIRNRGG